MVSAWADNGSDVGGVERSLILLAVVSTGGKITTGGADRRYRGLEGGW